MSHFVGLVFGDNVEELLAPYDEGVEVDQYVRYTKEEAIDEVKRRHADNYEYAITLAEKYKNSIDEYEQGRLEWAQKIIEKGLTISYEDAWEEAKEWGYGVNKDDNLLSTYNPNSKWDWYCEGGRWNGYLPSKMTDMEGSPIMVNWGLVGDIDWDKFLETSKAPFCFVTQLGEWHESASMGWWGVTSDDKEEEAWNTEFREYLESLSDDVEVTVIDFHI